MVEGGFEVATRESSKMGEAIFFQISVWMRQPQVLGVAVGALTRGELWRLASAWSLRTPVDPCLGGRNPHSVQVFHDKPFEAESLLLIQQRFNISMRSQSMWTFPELSI